MGLTMSSEENKAVCLEWKKNRMFIFRKFLKFCFYRTHESAFLLFSLCVWGGKQVERQRGLVNQGRGDGLK